MRTDQQDSDHEDLDDPGGQTELDEDPDDKPAGYEQERDYEIGMEATEENMDDPENLELPETPHKLDDVNPNAIPASEPFAGARARSKRAREPTVSPQSVIGTPPPKPKPTKSAKRTERQEPSTSESRPVTRSFAKKLLDQL